MYGAMMLKYSSGAQSFVTAVSYTIYENPDDWTKNSPIDPYYSKYSLKSYSLFIVGIFIFGALSLTFSFGNIENAKVL